VKLSVVKLSVVKLPVVKLPIVKLSVVKLPVVNLSVVKLPVVKLPVVKLSCCEAFLEVASIMNVTVFVLGSMMEIYATYPAASFYALSCGSSHRVAPQRAPLKDRNTVLFLPPN
jgi:hypothetical protein